MPALRALGYNLGLHLLTFVVAVVALVAIEGILIAGTLRPRPPASQTNVRQPPALELLWAALPGLLLLGLALYSLLQTRPW